MPTCVSVRVPGGVGGVSGVQPAGPCRLVLLERRAVWPGTWQTQSYRAFLLPVPNFSRQKSI